MDNNIFEQMMSRYPLDTSNDRRNATYEVMQQCSVSLAITFIGTLFYYLVFLQFHRAYLQFVVAGLLRKAKTLQFNLFPFYSIL